MKFSTYILLLVIIIAIFLALFVINHKGFISNQPQTMHNDDINGSMIEDTPASNYTILVSKDICEGCHMSGKGSVPQAMSVKPHVNGGAYCLICHNFSHQMHPTNQNVTCEKCHGTNSPTKPTFTNGNISCNNCHNYPDPLQPSNGNLITIHRPRGVTCNNCHTNECTKCHAEIGTSERWEKRLNHLRVILNAQ